ncbi:MAG: hypothetical protein ACO4AI_14010, partial [Prochlorothrix sp.]
TPLLSSFITTDCMYEYPAPGYEEDPNKKIVVTYSSINGNGFGGYGEVVMGMELKVWREGKRDPLAKGLEQLDQYLAGLGLETGWLVIFDRRPGLPPIEDRTTTEMAVSPSGRTIVVIRG